MNIKKTVYYDWSIQELEKIKSLKIRPTILIHGCCAPCSSFPLEFLSPYMDITIYHNNSNVYPIPAFNATKSLTTNVHPSMGLRKKPPSAMSPLFPKTAA